MNGLFAHKQKMALGVILAGAILAAGPAMAEFPQEGKPITVIVPFSAGGPTDVSVRILAPFLERELGTEIVVVNKPGASTQVGVTELTQSEPDGHTIAVVPPPTTAVTYLDPSRNAAYGRDDIRPVSLTTADANLVVVPGDSPFQTIDELIEFAKANPNGLKVGTSGLMTSAHFAGVELQAAADVDFAFVHFAGAAPEATAMLGGNLDAAITGILITAPHVKSGGMRVLATLDDKETEFFPGVKPIRELGYDVYSPVTFGVIAPGGTPDDVVAKLDAAIGRVMSNPEVTKKLKDVATTPNYMSTAEFEDFWTLMEETRTASLRLIAEEEQQQ